MTPLVDATAAAEIAERFRNCNSSEMPDDCEVGVVVKPRKYRYIRPFSDAAEDLIDICQNTDGRWMFGIQSIDAMTRGLGRGELMYVTGRAHCFDPETSILTDRGWVDADTVRVGDRTWGLNADTGVSEWGEVLELIDKQYDGDMLSMEGKTFSSLTTPEHRWFVTSQYNLEHEVGSMKVKTSSELNTSDYIPSARAAADGIGDLTDDQVRLLGWVSTDGWFETSGNAVSICQSMTANPDKCDLIDKLFANLGVTPRILDRPERADQRVWTIAGTTGAWVRSELPNKRLTTQLLDRLTQDQRMILIEVLRLADGYMATDTAERLLTSYVEVRDAYSTLLAQAGVAYTLAERQQDHWVDGYHSERVMYVFTLGTRKNNRVARQSTQWVPYSGRVWCVHTTLGSVFVRRGKSTYYSGQSGKTQLVLQSFANNPNAHVILFTPDEVDVLVLSKLVSIVRGIDGEQLEHRIRNRDERTMDMVRRCAADDFRNLIVIDDSLTFDQMTVALKEAREYWGCREDVTVVDFLELMPGDGAGNDSVVGKSQGMKAWGKGNETPLICLHQASRSSGARGTSAGMNAMRYGGECLTHDTLLDMADGSRRRADEIQAGDEVIAWGKHDGPIVRDVLRVWDNGLQPIFEVTTSRGRQLRVTGNHPILTRRGWVRADQITTADDVRIAISHIPNVGGSVDYGYFVGSMLGDGHIGAASNKRTSFTNDDAAIIAKLDSVLASLFDARLQSTTDPLSFTVRGNQHHENLAWKELDLLGLAGHRSWEKFIPPAVFSAGMDTWLGVVAALVDTDGSIDTAGRIVVTHTVSEQLARDTQALCARLGFQTSLTVKHKDGARPLWRVTLNGGSDAQLRFGQIIPIAGRKRHRLLEVAPPRPGRPNRGGLMGWDAVSSVAVVGVQPTLAIEVELDHTFITNGIVTHNTEATFVLEVFRKLEDTTLEEWERDLVLDTVTVNVAKNKRPPSKKGEVDLFMDPNTGAIRMPKPGDTGVRVTQALPSSVMAVSRTAELLGTYAQQKDSNGTTG